MTNQEKLTLINTLVNLYHFMSKDNNKQQEADSILNKINILATSLIN